MIKLLKLTTKRLRFLIYKRTLCKLSRTKTLLLKSASSIKKSSGMLLTQRGSCHLMRWLTFWYIVTRKIGLCSSHTFSNSSFCLLPNAWSIELKLKRPWSSTTGTILSGLFWIAMSLSSMDSMLTSHWMLLHLIDITLWLLMCSLKLTTRLIAKRISKSIRVTDPTSTRSLVLFSAENGKSKEMMPLRRNCSMTCITWLHRVFLKTWESKSGRIS